jgi:predicted Zn finger-like uncharacterized protein
MRLICPNCGAQYEVADDVIPAAGRDVQCSNCSHTWFEQPGASEAAEAGEPLPPPPPVMDVVDDEDEPSVPVTAPPESSAVPAEADADDFADLALEDDALPEVPAAVAATVAASVAAAVAATPRRGLSEDLADMLREEAAREAAARAAETPPRPAEPGLPPLTGPTAPDDQRDEEVRRRTARLRGEDPTPPRPVTPATRRELLPDIEMINSSLRPSSQDDHIPAAEPAVQSRKRGARFGFSTVMLIVAILVGLYVGAPRLSALVPAAEPVLTRYVAVVDDIRLWIDLRMQAFIADQSGTNGANDQAPASETPATAVPATEPPATEPPASDSTVQDPVTPVAPSTEQSSG